MTIEEGLAPEPLECEADRSLAEAPALVVHHRGREARERHRGLLAQAIDQAERALAAADREKKPRAESILARAHAASAEDALHGARQLSLSAQRAPTLDGCEEGWRRVESIVVTAEEASHAAGRAVGAMAKDSSSVARAARAAADRAASAARAAREIVDDRNRAYTFHTDFGFSCGEGWYLAAPLAPAREQADGGRRRARLPRRPARRAAEAPRRFPRRRADHGGGHGLDRPDVTGPCLRAPWT